MDYPRYFLTADLIGCYPDGKIVMIKRKKDPFRELYALPGGHLDPDETLEECCAREALEEINLQVSPSDLTLVGVYSAPHRDPRYRAVSACYITPLSADFKPIAGSDAEEVVIVDPSTLTPDDVAFDHYRMLVDADLID